MMATDLAVALSDMRGGAGTEETVDVVSLETVRDALEAALEKELKDADGQEVLQAKWNVFAQCVNIFFWLIVRIRGRYR